MKKTVYCSDVDGTLARQSYFLTEDTLALVHEMVDADINFTIVTGRFLSRSLPVMQQLKLKIPAFCLSGALAYDCANERILKVWPIKAEIAKTVAERLQDGCLSASSRTDDKRKSAFFHRPCLRHSKQCTGTCVNSSYF